MGLASPKLAPMSLFDEIDAETGEILEKGAITPFKPTIQKIRFTHDAVIDEIIANPSISQGELSVKFGFTQSWMSIIINADAFQERLAERKAQLVDPVISASIEDRLGGIARKSMDEILNRLDNKTATIKNPDLIAMARLGVGDRTLAKTPLVQNNSLYVVNLPPPAPDAKNWAETAQGRAKEEITDARVYD